jgi:hypothetical protein
MKYLYIICFSIFLFLIICFYPGWNFDDTGFWLNSYKFKDFNFILHFSNDRFAPLNTISSKLISTITFNPFYFLFYNFIISFSTFVILIQVCKSLNIRFYYLPVFIVFTTGFITTFCRTYHGERELFFLWSLFVFLLYRSKNYQKFIYLSILPIFLALFFKETSFLFITFFWFYFYRIEYFNLNNKIKFNTIFFIIGFLIICFVIIYLIFTNPLQSESYYNKISPNINLSQKLSLILKSLVLYIISDPILLIALPLFYLLNKKYSNIENSRIFNILTYTVFSFTLLHIIIGIHSNYYLFPAYSFTFIALSGYISNLYNKKIYLTFLYKIQFTFFFILFFNSLILTFNEYRNIKFSSKGYMAYQSTLNSILNKSNSRINLYMPGKLGLNYYKDIQTHYLEFYNIDTSKFTLTLVDKLENNINKKTFSKGDIILFTPGSIYPNKYILESNDSLNYTILFETNYSHKNLPNIESLLRSILMKYKPNLFRSKTLDNDINFKILII